MNKSTVAGYLEDLGQIYEDRSRLYGDNYKKFGSIMMGIVGKISIESSDDWTRIGLLVQIVGKITRYGNQFSAGGHPDSLDDCAVYAQMLQEIDKEQFISLNSAKFNSPTENKKMTTEAPPVMKKAFEQESNTPEEEMIDYERIFLNDKR